MDTTIIELKRFQDVCCEVESIAAALYSFLAEYFEDEPDISCLWRKMANEEENHARHVILANKMVASVSWINIDSWRNASQARDMIKKIFDRLHHAPPTLEEALHIAIKCEHKMDYLHMVNALLMKDHEGSILFQVMLKEDREHIRMLEEVLEEVKGREEYEVEVIEPCQLLDEAMVHQLR